MFLLRRVGPWFAHHVFLWVTCWKAAATGDTCLPRLEFKVLFTKTSIGVHGSSSHRLIMQCFLEVYRKFLFELATALTSMTQNLFSDFLGHVVNISTRHFIFELISVYLFWKLIFTYLQLCSARNTIQLQSPVYYKVRCKRTQHCWPTTPNIVRSCYVRLHVAKSLTSFKLCATTPNIMRQGVQTESYPTMLGVVGQKCCVRLHRA